MIKILESVSRERNREREMEYSDHHFDVIVVGAGIMGSSTAYQTAKRGHKTLLLEQFDFLHHRGSSHGESRTTRATYPESYYSRMVMESSQLWQEAESEIGYKVYFKTTHLDMAPSNDKSLKAVIKNCQSNSIPNQILDSTQVSDHFSGKIQIPENWVGLVTDLGGVLKPTKAVAMYQTLAVQNGATLKDNVEVREIKRESINGGGIVVYTANGLQFRGRKCVVTVGAWMKKLVKSVSGLDLPIQPLETTKCYWRIKPGHESQFTIDANFPTFNSYGKPYIYGTPSLEYPGLIKVAINDGFSCDPDKRPWEATNGTALCSLKQWIKERFAGWVETEEGPVATLSCMYSMTPDEDFVIDFLGGEFGEDVVIGGGFSGHGFKMAPVVGKVLADLVIDDGEAKGGGGVELKHFRVGRFVENGGKGNVKDFEDQVK